MAVAKRRRVPKAVRRYMARIGANGGRAGTGKAKARSSAQARRAARARWGKGRAKK